MTGNAAYALAKGYTDETVIGGGAIKGKNCTISSITEIEGGHRVTFNWTLDNGTTKSQTLDVMNGADGYTPQKDIDYFDGEKGEKGDAGNGITTITKTSTAGIVDTYTILFDDGDTTTFNVINGANISKVSELENDENFVKSTTISLVNYYLKDEAYSKAQIDELLRNVGAGLSVKIVGTLPVVDISPTTIYLINTSGSNYNQYMYIDGSWANLGSTAVDMSSYYNKTQIDTKLEDYVTANRLTNKLDDYVEKDKLSKVGKSNSYNDLDDLPEIPDVSGLKPYVETLQDSVNTAPVSKVVYDAVQGINTALEDKADKTDLVEINDTSTTATDKVWSAKKINASLVDIKSMIDGVYTEEEKVVGKWIDGKPIYRKVYKITLSAGLVTIGNIANVDTYLGCKGSYTSTSNNKLNIPWAASSEYTDVLIDTAGNVKTTSNLSGRNCVIVIEYTKATD